jgi:pimeloyl-ACP methyl ester carboxylesterase
MARLFTVLTLTLLAHAGLAHAGQPETPAAAPAPAQAAPAQAPAPAAAPERWKGTIEVPGMPNGLGFELALTRQPGPSATLSIPMQGFKDGPLSDVAIDQQKLRFTLKPPGAPEAAWARFEVTIADDGQSARGTMKQMSLDLPVTMSRLQAGESVALDRPQHPKPPFPYRERTVEVLAADGAVRGGTLTLPEPAAHGPGPYAAALLITGSGTQDRDETIFGHKPFLVIADHLTRRGIAVLRLDDRGYGGAHDPLGDAATTKHYADDAAGAVKWLAQHPEIDPTRVGLIGHSEGGVIAPMVAADHPDQIAFLVLLAGTGVPGREVLSRQIVELAFAGREVPATERTEIETALREALTPAYQPEPFARAMDRIGRVQLGVGEGQEFSPEQRKAQDAATASLTEGLTSPWMTYFLDYDPRPALEKVRVPVLVLNGSLDRQVLADQNVPAIEAALKRGGNTQTTVRILPGLNHLFQTATTGGGNEYGSITETFAPAALDEISTWLATITAKPKP